MTPSDYKACSLLYVPDESRLSRLVDMPEEADLGKAADAAMNGIEIYNPELKDVLPKLEQLECGGSGPRRGTN